MYEYKVHYRTGGGALCGGGPGRARHMTEVAADVTCSMCRDRIPVPRPARVHTPVAVPCSEPVPTPPRPRTRPRPRDPVLEELRGLGIDIQQVQGWMFRIGQKDWEEVQSLRAEVGDLRGEVMALRREIKQYLGMLSERRLP